MLIWGTATALAGIVGVAVAFDGVLNSVAVWYVRSTVSRAMEGYQANPPDARVLVLVDAQNGFLSPGICEALVAVVDFARNRQYHIIYASWDADTEPALSTPAHDWIASRLRDVGASAFPTRIAPRDGDTVLRPRSTFSAFSNGELEGQLGASGLDHLILAGPLTLLSLDSTLRDAVQRDYHVTVLRADDVAYSESSKGAFERTYWRYAHSVIKPGELQALTDGGQ